MAIEKDLKRTTKAMRKNIEKRFRRTPLEVFEDYIWAITEFILILIAIPFVALAYLFRGWSKK